MKLQVEKDLLAGGNQIPDNLWSYRSKQLLSDLEMAGRIPN